MYLGFATRHYGGMNPASEDEDGETVYTSMGRIVRFSDSPSSRVPTDVSTRVQFIPGSDCSIVKAGKSTTAEQVAAGTSRGDSIRPSIGLQGRRI